MKIGIIIICHNNEVDIDAERCIRHLNNVKSIEFCLVNNNSKDNTYKLLKEISETCTNVSVVNIKKHKTDMLAVRAGARFMSNQFDLKHLGFVDTNMISKYKVLSMLIKAIQENQVVISNYNLKILYGKKIKQTMFQSLFPVIDYLAKISIENQYTNLNTNTQNI